MLGLYRVAPGGVDVEITITEQRRSGDAGGRSRQSAADARAARQGGPTRHETALVQRRAAPAHEPQRRRARRRPQLADTARDAGYDFIAITDHNNTTHTREPLPPSPLHITGEEVTTPARARDA